MIGIGLAVVSVRRRVRQVELHYVGIDFSVPWVMLGHPSFPRRTALVGIFIGARMSTVVPDQENDLCTE